MIEQVATIKLSKKPYIVLPEKVGHQIHWRDGQKVRIRLAERGIALTTSGVKGVFERTLETYLSTNDEILADNLLDMLDGCLGDAIPGEYDPDLKWGRYYEGR